MCYSAVPLGLDLLLIYVYSRLVNVLFTGKVPYFIVLEESAQDLYPFINLLPCGGSKYDFCSEAVSAWFKIEQLEKFSSKIPTLV